VRAKAVYLALGINLRGKKDLLGLWIAQTEGAKFLLQVVTELKNRGVNDIFIVCVDGLKGFPDAIATVFPHADVQLCLMHMVRHSLKFVNWKQRKEVVVEAGEQRLAKFEEKWNQTPTPIGQSWRRNWERVIPFFGYPPEIRKVIYTTNAIESINMSLRKITKNRGSFPSDDSLAKLSYKALQNISREWTVDPAISKARIRLNQIRHGRHQPLVPGSSHDS